ELGGRIDPHRERGVELAEEAGKRGSSHVLGRGSNYLQTPWAIVSLHFGKSADRLLTMGTVSQDEGDHDGLAFVLADAHLFALAEVDGEIRRGTRQFGGPRRGQRHGQQS